MPGGESAVSRRAGGCRLPACPHDCPPRIDMTARRVGCPPAACRHDCPGGHCVPVGGEGAARVGGEESVVWAAPRWGVSVGGGYPRGRGGESAVSRLPAALPRLPACRHDCPPRAAWCASPRVDMTARGVAWRRAWCGVSSCPVDAYGRIVCWCCVASFVVLGILPACLPPRLPAALPRLPAACCLASPARLALPCGESESVSCCLASCRGG